MDHTLNLRKTRPVSQLEGDVPEGGHLVLYRDITTGHGIAIPYRAAMAIIPNPKNLSSAMKVALLSVTTKAITFKCMCSPGCTGTYRYKLEPMLGKHAR